MLGVSPLSLGLGPLALVLGLLALGLGPLALVLGPLALGLGPAARGQDPLAGCRVVESEVRPGTLQVQSKDLARQPALDRRDGDVLALLQPEPLERRLEVVFG